MRRFGCGLWGGFARKHLPEDRHSLANYLTLFNYSVTLEVMTPFRE